jgi:hypothetical protein
MTTNCDKCQFFRPYRPLSQLLARDLGIDDQPLVAELLKMMQDERQKRDEEAELKVKLLGDRVEQWPYEPMMTDYCGLLEAKSVFLFHEMKNRSGTCDRFKDRETPRPCQECRYLHTTRGPERDKAWIAELAKLAENSAAVGQAGGDQGMANYVQLVGTKKAFEAAQSYYAGKITMREPEYLAWCERHSTENDFVPCALHNRHDRCPDWDERQVGDGMIATMLRTRGHSL